MSRSVDFGRFELQCERAIRQLKQDMRDDWFPDPLAFEDMLDEDLVANFLQKAIEANHGVYVPLRSQLENIPKDNFTIRYALESNVQDRVLYHGLVSALVPHFDQALSWRVFSHRYNSDAAGRDRYLFKQAIKAWQDFLGFVGSEAVSRPVLLTTDLTNYYESIRLSRLRQNILALLPRVSASGAEKGQLRAAVDLLFEYLKKWSFEEDQGLPQNRDASSFLGNLMMAPIDEAMEREGYEYFRYMDDIRVVCRDKYEARRALKRLVVLLREHSLALNSKKTSIIEPSQEGYQAALGIMDPRLAEIESMWRSRQRQVIWASFGPLKSLANDLISKDKVGEREFRFCVHRLKLLALCKHLSPPAGFFDDFTDYVLDRFADQPAATDTFVNYLIAVPLHARHVAKLATLVRHESLKIYGWQMYRLWVLLAAKDIRDDSLIAQARASLEASDREAVRAGTALYLGAMGHAADREYVAERFHKLRSFLAQRHGIIAVHELPYRPLVEKFVKPFLRPDLVGVYRRLSREKPLAYIKPPEQVHYKRMYDDASAYE